jgi:hypothetical protein
MILGQDGRVTDEGLLPEAVAELYASGPDEFIERRAELAARARSCGRAAQAKQIAGLRKPTRSAWIINQLVRSDPSVGAQLADLGEQLRAAQSSLDGAALRDLSLQRRQLVDALARQAFTVAGQPSPPAATRDEVTATLAAALADPQVADRVRAGTLDRAAHAEGFGGNGFGGNGFGGAKAQVLTLVRPAPRSEPASGGGPPSGGASAGGKAAGSARGAASAARVRNGAAPSRARDVAAAPRAGQRAAAAADRYQAKTTELAPARARAERERRGQAISAAEQELAEADYALDAADQSEQDYDRAVQRLEVQLTEARHRLADARLEVRQAAAAQRQARQALDRLRA